MTLNPLLLAGQVHGGAVQGIGQALMEQAVYDRELRPARHRHACMDYALPRADDAPAFMFETRNVPCKTNPLGVKGAGEAGAIGSCPAVMNAVVDALWREYRIDHIDMPATPERVWMAIREGRRMQRCEGSRRKPRGRVRIATLLCLSLWIPVFFSLTCDRPAAVFARHRRVGNNNSLAVLAVWSMSGKSGPRFCDKDELSSRLPPERRLYLTPLSGKSPQQRETTE